MLGNQPSQLQTLEPRTRVSGEMDTLPAAASRRAEGRRGAAGDCVKGPHCQDIWLRQQTISGRGQAMEMGP